MTLHLYNTLTRKKDPFDLPKNKTVGLYTCGPTVYNYAHIGNLRAYIFADILKRTLIYNGYQVNHVMNITDVGHLTSDADTGEDKLEKGAKREGKTVWQVAKDYEKAFKNDIKKLNISEPDIWQRATENVEDKKTPGKSQIALIKRIEKNGFTYETDQALYFDVKEFEKKYPGEYTKLSKQKLEDKKVAVRCEIRVDPKKKHPADFALWLKRVGKYKDHVMHWSSPWGDGFPGWHVECSAISMKYLGEHFDIHTGGIDHIPVHHTNERAQNIAAIGHPVVERWMHNEFLVMKDGEKMAKSGENFLTLKKLDDDYIFHPSAFRFAVLQVHYRKPMEFNNKSIDGAKNGWAHLYNQVSDLAFGIKDKNSGKIIKKFKTKFLEVINDDLNTPQALAVVQEVLKSGLSDEDKLKTVLDFDEVLGLELNTIAPILSVNYFIFKYKGNEFFCWVPNDTPKEIRSLAIERFLEKHDQKYKDADKKRDTIEDQGYLIEDMDRGFKIKKK